MSGALQTQANADFFDAMLEMIPARYYMPQEVNTEQWKSRFMKNKKQSAPQLALKLASKKARRAKFNGESSGSVLALQKAESQAEDAPSGMVNAAGTLEREPAKTIDGLRERLALRIKALKSGRGGTVKRGADAAGSSKKARRAAKRAMKRDRAIKRSGGAADVRSNAVAQPSTAKRTEAAAAAVDSARDAADAPKMLFQNLVFTGDGNDGRDDVVGGKQGERGVPGVAGKKKGKKSLKDLLKQAETKQKRLEELKQSGAGKALLKAEAWDTMMSRAKGEKVKDDAKLIRKALKRKEKARKKSAKAWSERAAKEEATKQAAYDKKMQNIEERKNPKARLTRLEREADEKKGAKGGRKPGRRGAPGGEFDKKRKRSGAGFEGKHSGGFLNKGKEGKRRKTDKGSKGKGQRLRYEDFKGRGGVDR